MAKTKKVTVKPAKVSLISKIVKRKSMKRSSAVTSKLKNLNLAQAKALADKNSTFTVSTSSSESENEIEVVKSNFEIKSPRHFLAPPKSPVNLKQTEEAINALFEFISKSYDKNAELFDDEQPIFLQITSVKVPKTPNRQIRFNLKNTLLSDSSEICLIVKDEGKAKDYDGTIEHYEELLKDKEVTNIKTIMPYHQFKTEYGNQYELVRKLLGLYDYFLVDGRIGGYVTHRLGKIFLEKRKMPASVKMDASNLREHFTTCLNKTLMKLHGKSDYYIVQVGHTKMTEHDVFENVSHIIDQFDVVFPGGLDNIRSLAIKTDKSLAVPIYLTLKNKSDVKVPVTLAKRPKLFQKVTGELTTFLDRDVTVLPTGEIIVSKQGLENDSDGEEGVDSDFEENGLVEEDDHSSGDGDEKDVEEDADEVVEQAEEKGKVSDEEEEEGILDQAEEVYLNQYQQEQVTTRKAKKAKVAMVENDEIPIKRPKRAIKEPKENIVPITKPAAKKKVTKSKKEGNEKMGSVNTRTRGIKAKPEEVIPVEKVKKAMKTQEKIIKVKTSKNGKKEATVVIPEQKPKKQKGLVKNSVPVQEPESKPKNQKGSKKTNAVVKEDLAIKPKITKQKGSTKTNQRGDGPVQVVPETKPKTTRKTKATNIEEAVPVKKTKPNKKTVEEEKPTKTKGKAKPAEVATINPIPVTKKSKKPAAQSQNKKDQNKKITSPVLKTKRGKK